MSLAVCSVFQNEAPWLREWIEFHRLVGVELFILYNNLSTDNFREILQPYVQKGIVRLYDWPLRYRNLPEWTQIQCNAFSNAIIKARENHIRWIAVIDSDEFLYSPKVSPGQSILSILDKYLTHPAVAVNWQLYGTSGVRRISPDKLMIESLIMKAEVEYNENRQVKCIVQPFRTTHFCNPHYGIYANGTHVTTRGTPIEGAWSPHVLIDTLRINHYWSRDEEYFEQRKCTRRTSWSEEPNTQRARLANINKVIDKDICRFASLLRTAMNGKR